MCLGFPYFLTAKKAPIGNYRAHCVCWPSARGNSPGCPVVECLEAVVLYILCGFLVVYYRRTSLIPGTPLHTKNGNLQVNREEWKNMHRVVLKVQNQ